MYDKEEFIKQIAKVCHEANSAFRATIGEGANPSFEEVKTEHREIVISGVRKILSGEIKSPEESHQSWVNDKIALGWEKKDHPCMVPWNELSFTSQFKDILFFNIVKTFESSYYPPLKD